MAVNFSGINVAPQVKAPAQQAQHVAFTAAPKVDTVSFGNTQAITEAVKSEPAKNLVKKVLEFVTKNLGKIKDFIMNNGKKLIELVKKFNPLKLIKKAPPVA